MKKIAIIMAGGAGERFWPFSRKLKPKQLLPLTGEKSMLSESIAKISPRIPPEDCYIVTNILLRDAILADIPDFPARNILCEPIGKNTAPCLGFASAVLSKKYGDCVIAVLTADHLIKKTDIYINNIDLALKSAEEDEAIVTLGIPPNRPETGYGYIQIDRWISKGDNGDLATVKCFHEKPNLETAQKYFISGEFFWNSGMFFYKNSTMLKAFSELTPNLYEQISKIRDAYDTPAESDAIKQAFDNFESISIDFAVMEKFKNIKMVRADFSWDDIGSWTSLERIGKTDERGNVIIGDVIALDTEGTIVYSETNPANGKKPLVGLIGVKDFVVVSSGGCVLVCPKDKVQDVKKIVVELKKQGKIEHT